MFVVFHDMAHEHGVPPPFTGSPIYLVSLATRNQKILPTMPGLSSSGPRFPALASSSQCLSYRSRTLGDVDRYVNTRIDTPSFYSVVNIRGSVMNPPSMSTKLLRKSMNLSKVRLRPGLIANLLRGHSVRPMHVNVSGQFCQFWSPLHALNQCRVPHCVVRSGGLNMVRITPIIDSYSHKRGVCMDTNHGTLDINT